MNTRIATAIIVSAIIASTAAFAAVNMTETAFAAEGIGGGGGGGFRAGEDSGRGDSCSGGGGGMRSTFNTIDKNYSK